MSGLTDKITQIGTGQGYLAHPIHPSTVHWPIGFLSASFALDTLKLIGQPGLTGIFNKVLPPAAAIDTLAHFAGAAGLLCAVPSVLSGGSELTSLIKQQVKAKGSIGQVATDALARKDLPSEKIFIAVIHAVMNDLVIGVAAYNWWIRRQSAVYALPLTNQWLSAAIGLPVLMYSAYLGGDLVYRLGYAVKRNSAWHSKEQKE